MVNQGIQTPVISVRTTFNMIPLAYLAGFLVTLALALVSLLSVARIIVTARPVEYRRQRLLISSKKINSFTFSRWIVLSEMDYERFSEEIVAHEIIHLRNGHFWDLCMVNAIVILQWFNPLAWLLRRELKALHEYEADRSTLTQGINATRYQLLLIEKAAGASRYSVASCFAQSKIKKRIVMMNKQNPNPRARWKALLFIPLAALLMQCFSRPDINREPDNHEHIILPQQFKPSIAGATSEMIPDRAASSDLFFPHGFKNPRKYQFAIFNKTGQKVFDTTDPKQGWNGYFEGALCEEGVYRYRIEGEFENGQPFLKTGDVTLQITTPMTQEDIWEKIREEFLSNLDRQITINGKTMKFRNIDSELPEEYKTYQLIFSTTHNARLGVVNEQTAQVRWPLSNFILNGQWITDEDADVNIKKIVSVKTYTAAEAENLFGVKTENGTIAIVTQ